MADGTSGGPEHGLRGSLARLGAAVLGLVHTRLELATVELDEERTRIVARLVLVLVAILGFGGALVAASALVVVWFWDSYRIAALAGVAIAYLLLGLGALLRFRLQKQAAPPPFAGTLAELDRDRAWIADKLGGGR